MGKKIITIGEIMMRMNTPEHLRFSQADTYHVTYGGAEANVAISLAQFGLETSHVTAFPDNDLGTKASSYLRQNGLDTQFVYFREGRMGLYFLENGSMQRASRIIYDRFDSAFANFDGNEIDWDLVFEGASWFHWTGITPAISQKAADLLLKALKVASSKGLTISADINYRRNLWQYGKGPLDIMPELIRYSHVIVAGSSDFENCMDIKVNDWADACFQAKSDFPNIRYITKTKRESISASHNRLKGILWNGKEVLKSKTYEITHIVDRVGGGDAFIAGLIYGLLHTDDQVALEFATAASVLKHSIPGDANLVKVEEVFDLVHDKNVGKLLR
ncbi:2-dehydro-3-deoxygluconate kinase [Indibacter alkaliphilus LW1]|uniref:2-dehydro-3-deoxygluconate kinase n=1 Tax=Indibacter alkaliphilus (strain CCUG 57479 / KCTC 22604 / LW1) TaxID=1189612 RepID=S2E214_INDAL|nr:sugar kinase [Indibacter alkaliphilus]EOZ98516.1 2-dehydro-3-deoxygluconate kinase [Indibacter alkaliphilus LW1]